MKPKIKFTTLYFFILVVFSNLTYAANFWELKNNGIPEEEDVVNIVEKGDTLFCNTNNGIYFSTNNGDLWNKFIYDFNGNIYNYDDIYVTDKSYLLNESDGLIYVGQDLKGERILLDPNLLNINNRYSYTIINVVSKSNIVYLAADVTTKNYENYSTIYKSTDYGKTWENTDFIVTVGSNPYVTDRIVDIEINDNYFYVLSATHLVRSSNDWLAFDTLTIPEHGLYGKIGLSNNNIFGRSKLNTFLVSSDNCLNWNISFSDVTYIFEITNNWVSYKNNIFLTAYYPSHMFLLTTDNGISWKIGATPTNGTCYGTLIDSEYVYVSASSNSNIKLYRASLKEMTNIQSVETVADNQKIIFPNPAYNLIYFTQPLDYKNCKFQIYNSIGLLIKSGILDSDHIDIENLSYGVYNLKIISNNKYINVKFIKYGD